MRRELEHLEERVVKEEGKGGENKRRKIGG